MCNPRRVEVTATRQVAEAWHHEVKRAATRSGLVTGEARICQPLDVSIGAPAIAAMERALEAGIPGWRLEGDAYRHDVEGGYVLYSLSDRTLTIVATASDEVTVRGEVTERLEGRLEAELAARGQGVYYDDGYGGRTEDKARGEAARAAEAHIETQLRTRIEEERKAAEDAAAQGLEAGAKARAEAIFADRAAERRAALERAAAERMAAVGVQARLSFHRLLAIGYRDALLALARSRGAQSIACDESGDTLDIEFLLPG